MKKLISMLCLAAVCVVAGSTKDKNANACNQLLTQPAPPKVLLKFIDKSTEANILGSAGLTNEEISIANVKTGANYQNWRIVQHKVLDEGVSALEITFSPSESGNHSFRINLGDRGEAVLDFMVTRHESTSPCSGSYLTISDSKISREFSYFEYQDVVQKNVLVVKI